MLNHGTSFFGKGAFRAGMEAIVAVYSDWGIGADGTSR